MGENFIQMLKLALLTHPPTAEHYPALTLGKLPVEINEEVNWYGFLKTVIFQEPLYSYICVHPFFFFASCQFRRCNTEKSLEDYL